MLTDVTRLRSASSLQCLVSTRLRHEFLVFMQRQSFTLPCCRYRANALGKHAVCFIPAPASLLTVQETDGWIKPHQTFTTSQTRPQQTHCLTSEESIGATAALSRMRAQMHLRHSLQEFYLPAVVG